jgi:hypothetical protein
MNALQRAKQRQERIIAAGHSQREQIERLRQELREERKASQARKAILVAIAQGDKDPDLLAALCLAVYPG